MEKAPLHFNQASRESLQSMKVEISTMKNFMMNVCIKSWWNAILKSRITLLKSFKKK